MNNNLSKLVIFIVGLLVLNSHKLSAILSIIILLLYGIRSRENSVKAILLSYLLSQLNAQVFNSSISEFRTILNLFLIFNIFFDCYKSNKLKINGIIRTLLIYYIYIIVSALFTSWLPFVSIFKGTYFVLGMIAMFLVLGDSSKKFDWMDWLRDYFICIILINMIFVILPQGYYRNGIAFNGMFNNPNPLGITLTYAIVVILYDSIYRKKYKRNIVFILIGLCEVFITDSRTSLISITIVLGYFLLVSIFTRQSSLKRWNLYMSILCFIISVIIALSPVYISPLTEQITTILLKNQDSDNILYSREGQIKQFINDYSSNQLFGVGFGVTGRNGKVTDYSIKLSYPVERGNIFMAILAETGIVGMILFIMFIIYILKYNFINNKRIYFFYKIGLVFLVILTSLGEMTFFSGNNLGVIQWFILALVSYDNS